MGERISKSYRLSSGNVSFWWFYLYTFFFIYIFFFLNMSSGKRKKKNTSTGIAACAKGSLWLRSLEILERPAGRRR